MKGLLKLLNLILCLELIVGPMLTNGSSGLFMSAAYAEPCPAGTSFDTTLNRCLTSEQTADVMNAVANCKGDKACYKSTAENALKEAEEEGKVKTALANKAGLFNTSMKAATVAVPLTMAVSMMKSVNAKCASVSIWAMLGGGLALFAGDTLANMQHKGRLKKIKKEWDVILKGDSATTSTAATASTSTTSGDSKVQATEAQSEAFEMLARSEESLASAAKMKTGFFGVATAAFAASAVLATLEAIKPPPANAGDICPTTPKPESGSPAQSNFRNVSPLFNYKIAKSSHALLLDAKNLPAFLTLKLALTAESSRRSSPSIDEYHYFVETTQGSGIEKDPSVLSMLKTFAATVVHELNPLKSSHASPITFSGVSKFLLKPVTRAVFSGLLTAWAGTMTLHAMKQAKVSSNRAKFLRNLKDEFNDATGSINSCSSADRANPAVPNCYCYTAEGARNGERTNSSVCTALFTGKSASTTAGNYLLNSSVEGQGCISAAGATDSTCACRASNTCLKATSAGLGSINPGTFSMLSSPLTAVDNLGNGSLDAASVNGSASVSNASRLLDAANKLAEKSKNGEELQKGKSELANSMANSLTTAGQGQGAGDLLGSGSSSLGNLTPSQAVAELEHDLKIADKSSVVEVKSAETVSTPANSPEEKLEFGVSSSDLAAQGTQMAEVMEKNLDYGTNDINTGSTTNIFEVLSHRYQRSGMRRLFDDEGKMKADKASKSDVSP